MSGTLRPEDHYILRKLGNEILPWLIAGRRVDRLWFVWAARVSSYAGDLGALLAGLGIGAPLSGLLAAGQVPQGSSAIDILRQHFTGPWFWVAVAGLGLWIVMRLVVKNEDVAARAALARETALTMRALHSELWRSLSQPDPMPRITEIQKSVDDKVRGAIANRIWPYDPPHALDPVDVELGRELDDIRRRFMDRWPPPPPGVI